MSLRGRIIILIIILIVGAMFISPTIQWYFLIPEESKDLALGSLPQIKQDATTKAAAEYAAFLDFIRESEGFSPYGKSQGIFLEKLYASVDPEAYKTAVEGRVRDNILSVKQLRDLTMQLGLDLQGGLNVSLSADFNYVQKQLEEQAKNETNESADKKADDKTVTIDKDRILQDAMERLLSRFDQFGTVEPIIRRQIGTDNIIVELPGAADVERVRKVILGKGTLAFHLVDDEMHNAFKEYLAQNTTYVPKFNANGEVIPPADFELKSGVKILGYYGKDDYGMDDLLNFVAISNEIGLPGEAIKEARATVDIQESTPIVQFTIDTYIDANGETKDGIAQFRDLTEKNKGKFLAVVMDQKVMSYPYIKDTIPNGQVRVTGDFSYQDTEDLAKVLKTGALPVPLIIGNTSAVGASLGEDTIVNGMNAMIIGALLVLAFMLVYYKGAGFIANIALVSNIFLLLTLLSVTNFTLTLTSIAGIILTIGMAVDANVIIYERIKEEYHLGKTPKAAVKAGFSRAFWTILDSNVTTFIAGIVLALFTKGSIQGFAFTLCVGIVTSFFTALFVSRILFDFSTDVLRSSKLSISWRRLQ
ncbi:MAG: protein translocase subunit SecD [Spirochaetales bacterium]|nr:protein translocase subunit SecD [Spirochaetales bacterium]